MSACPPEDVLTALLEKQIPAGAAARLREHVDSCRRCLDVLARPEPMTPPTVVWKPLDEEQAPPSAADWMPPSMFDDFRIVRPLGRGGMGRVYLGQDIVLDRPVALKFVAADSPDPRASERFYLE